MLATITIKQKVDYNPIKVYGKPNTSGLIIILNNTKVQVLKLLNVPQRRFSCRTCIPHSNFTAPSLLLFSTKHAPTRLFPQDLWCISDTGQRKEHILLLQQALVSEGVSAVLANPQICFFLTSSVLILSYVQILTKSSLFGVFIESVVYGGLKMGHIQSKKVPR